MNTKSLRWLYCVLSALLLLSLVFIEGTSGFLRGTVGDFVVVLFLHALVRIIKPRGLRLLPLYIFLFACMVEFLQFINIFSLLVNLLSVLGIGEETVKIAVGSVFDWMDILAYAVGCIVAALWDGGIRKFLSES